MIFNYSAKPVFYVFFDDHINFNFQCFLSLCVSALSFFGWASDMFDELQNGWNEMKKLQENEKKEKKNSIEIRKMIRLCQKIYFATSHVVVFLFSLTHSSKLFEHDEKWSNIYQKKLKLTYWWRRLKSKHIFHTAPNGNGRMNEWEIESTTQWGGGEERKKNENNFTLLMSRAVEHSVQSYEKSFCMQ